MKIIDHSYGVREIGPNQGIPVLNLYLEEGKTKIEQNLEEMISLHRWDTPIVCIRGKSNLQGLGAFIKALKEMRFKSDLQLEVAGDTVGWIQQPDTVVVVYREGFNFNYYALRAEHYILFEVKVEEDIQGYVEAWEANKLTPATKVLVVPDNLWQAGFGLIREFKGARLVPSSILESFREVEAINGRQLEKVS